MNCCKSARKVRKTIHSSNDGKKLQTGQHDSKPIDCSGTLSTSSSHRSFEVEQQEHRSKSKNIRSILRVKTQEESMRSQFGCECTAPAPAPTHTWTSSTSYHQRRGRVFSNTKTPKKKQKQQQKQKQQTGSNRVSFSNVDIRQYPRTLGDNPSVCEGPPISIGWNHHSQEEVSVDDFEKGKLHRAAGAGADADEDGITRIDPSTRIFILERYCQISYADILRACHEGALIREQRIKSMKQSRNAARIESISKSLKQKMSLRRDK